GAVVDGDRHSGGGAVAGGVLGGVRESVRAVEGGAGRGWEWGSGGDDHAAVAAVGFGADRQRIAVRIAVVGQDVDRDRGVLIGGGAVVLGCHRGVVVDGDRHRGGGAVAGGILGSVGKTVRAVEGRTGR